MSPRLDRYGDPIEDDNTNRPVWRTRDEIHRDRIAQLRAILAESRARRDAQP